LGLNSFEEWCIDNDRQDVLNRWDYELNDKKPSEIGHGTTKKYYFNCPRGIHKSELKNINSFTNKKGKGNIKCKQCNSFAQWGINNIGEDFLEKYWDYEKNILNPWEVSYGNSSYKIYIKCQEKDYHGSYDITPNNFVHDSRCGYCTNQHGKVHLLDSLGTVYPKSMEVWSDKNKKTTFDYTPSTLQQVWFKCENKKHKDYIRSISDSNICEFRCPECIRERNESFLQEKIRVYLENSNYTILHELKCTIVPHNPKIKNKRGRMPFDNEIKELKLIIEVHGVQHYKITNFHYLQAKKNNTTPEKELHYQKLKDRYKRMLAKSKINNYYYLEIPYYTDDKDETWKKLINDKISEINRIINIKYIEQQNKSA